MNCILFAKIDQVFSLKNRTLKKYRKNGKKYWKSQGIVREFCQSRKVGTLCMFSFSFAIIDVNYSTNLIVFYQHP